MSSSAPMQVLRKCFSDKEWEWLSKQEAFTSPLATLNSFDDMEKLAALGDQLIWLDEQHDKEGSPIRAVELRDSWAMAKRKICAFGGSIWSHLAGLQKRSARVKFGVIHENIERRTNQSSA
jgi:hypothetical protein